MRLAPSMPAPFALLVAANRSCVRHLAAHLAALGLGGGTTRLVVIVDRGGGGGGGYSAQISAGQRRRPRAGGRRRSPPRSLSSAWCFDARSGEALVPNLDAVAVVTGEMQIPPCHRYRFAHAVRASLGAGDAGSSAARLLLPAFARGWLSALVRWAVTREQRFFLSDVLSAVAVLTRAAAGDDVAVAHRELRMRGTPTIVLVASPNDNTGGDDAGVRDEDENDDDAVGLAFVREHLWPGMFAFTFVHERLHHAQMAYHFTSGDRAASVNQLQFIVVAALVACVVPCVARWRLTAAVDAAGAGAAALLCALCLATGATPAAGTLHVALGLAIGAALATARALSPSGRGAALHQLWQSVAAISCCLLLGLVFALNLALALCLALPIGLAHCYADPAAAFVHLWRDPFAAAPRGTNDAAAPSNSGAASSSSAIAALAARAGASLWAAARWTCVALALLSGRVMLAPVLDVPLAHEWTASLLGPLMCLACSTLV